MTRWVAAIALALALLLLGCTQDSKQESLQRMYDRCQSEKNELANSLASESEQLKQVSAEFASCMDEKHSLGYLLENKEKEAYRLMEEVRLLEAAREKIRLAEKYELAMAHYLEAFGPGKIPNTPKMKRIDEQVESLDDAELARLWNRVKNCQGISGCDSAKLNFTKYINSKKEALMIEAASVIAEGSKK